MISDERLVEIAEDGFLHHGDSKAMAKELLALRKAFSDPIAWIHQTTGVMIKNSVIEEVRKQSGVWIPLYRKPTESTT